MVDPKKVIVALDGISELQALRIAISLQGQVWGFKINDLLYEDLGIIGRLKKFGSVFADLKIHDIPHTVGNTVSRLAQLGADLITAHASGGMNMLNAAKEHAGASKILAVTVLTSIESNTVANEARERAQTALDSDVDGIVCSGHELQILRSLPGMSKKMIVVPGIRPTWYREKDDQRRTVTAAEALEAGASYIVIGRPITKSSDPLKSLGAL